jgi:hypothetical protein
MKQSNLYGSVKDDNDFLIDLHTMFEDNSTYGPDFLHKSMPT